MSQIRDLIKRSLSGSSHDVLDLSHLAANFVTFVEAVAELQQTSRLFS